MGLLELFILAVGLSMDAFAVSICKGLSIPKINFKHAAIAGIWFGGFQALMPLIGYLLGVNFRSYIVSIDHWIAFILLAFIGGNMLKEALEKEEDDESCQLAVDETVDMKEILGFKTMFLLAIATSIDALAMGVTFAFLNVAIIPAISFIGVTTFVFSAVGVKIGNVFGTKYKSKAEMAGGIILILLGIKILVQHLGII